MTSPPINVFNSGAQMFLAPDEAATNADSQSPNVAADIQSSCGGVEGHAAAHLQPYAPCKVDDPIPQITAGAYAEQPENGGRMDRVRHSVAGVEPGPQEAISLFELCIRGFDQDKFLFDIGCIPDDFDKYMALMEALTDNDEPPLFLQRTG